VARRTLVLTRFLGKLRGVSQPILAETSDGRVMVVKFGANLHGPNLLFNEAMGSELYAAAGLAVPGWAPAVVGKKFLDDHPACWPLVRSRPLRPEPGVVFASNYIYAGAERVMQILPGSSLSRVERSEDFWLAWLIDVCAQHTDHRQALFVEQHDRRLRAVFIDHGQMFGGPAGDHEPRFRASRFLDSRLYPEPTPAVKEKLLRRVEAIDCEKLRSRAELLPERWKTPLAAGRFTACLGRLGRRSLLGNMLDTLFEDCGQEERQQDRAERFPAQPERHVGSEPGSQAAQPIRAETSEFGSRLA